MARKTLFNLEPSANTREKKDQIVTLYLIRENANSMRRQPGRFIGNTNAEQRKRGLGLGIVPNSIRIKIIYQ